MTSRNRQDLIKQLSTNVPPVTVRNSIFLPALVWFICSWFYVITISLYLGPIRPGALAALFESPQFAYEIMIGLLAGSLFCIIAFLEAIPGCRKPWLTALAYACGIGWISCYVAGLSYPALEPSMFGKRAHCVLEAYLYSAPSLISGYRMIYQRYPINAARAGLFLGICAGLLPALFMQIVCMYDPVHILTHHIVPMLLIALSGALLGKILTPVAVRTCSRSR